MIWALAGNLLVSATAYPGGFLANPVAAMYESKHFSRAFVALTLLFVSLSTTDLWAQVPAGINYQAVIRDGGQLLPNASVGVEFSIRRDGTELYREQQTLSTNGYSLLSTVVGEGSPLVGDFASIDWAQPGTYFLNVSLNTGGGLAELGASRLVSVPYSLYAARAATVDSLRLLDLLDVGGSPNAGQVLTWNGTAWEPQALPTYTAGAGISISGSTIANTGDLNPNDDITIATAAAGDLGGTYPAPAVTALQGRPVSNVLPGTGQVLKWNGSLWAPGQDSLGVPQWSEVGQNLYYDVGSVGIGTSSIAPYRFRVEGGSVRINNPNATALDGLYVSANTSSSSYAAIFAVNNGSGPAGYFSGTGGTSLIAQGRVGMGTTSPLTALEVRMSNAATDDGLRLHNASSGDALIRFAVGNTDRFALGVDNSDGDKLKIGAGSELTTGTALTIQSNGFVGIGTSAPQTNLTVSGGFAGLNGTGGVRYFGTVTSGAGSFEVRGANSFDNVTMASLAGVPDHGYLAVQDANGVIQAGVYVDINGQGIVFGDQKNFRMPHPRDPEQEIWYGSLEGPELAAYVRGTAQLVDGVAEVSFPEHFALVANPASMTVTLTPLDAASRGLAVVEKTPEGFRVRELMQGTGTYAFDWEVKCVRRGHEDYRVLRPAQEALPAQTPNNE